MTALCSLSTLLVLADVPDDYVTMSDFYAIRDEYVSGKRQELTLWSGPFASTYEGFARELPNHAGFMVRRYWHEDEPIRVACPAPRDEHNYQTVDAAINAALSREIGETK